jgi:hypothetical protein
MMRQTPLPPKMTQPLKNQRFRLDLLKAGEHIPKTDWPIEHTAIGHDELQMPQTIADQKMFGIRQSQDGKQRRDATDVENIFGIGCHRLDMDRKHRRVDRCIPKYAAAPGERAPPRALPGEPSAMLRREAPSQDAPMNPTWKSFAWPPQILDSAAAIPTPNRRDQVLAKSDNWRDRANRRWVLSRTEPRFPLTWDLSSRQTTRDQMPRGRSTCHSRTTSQIALAITTANRSTAVEI